MFNGPRVGAWRVTGGFFMLCVVCSPIRACRTIRTIALLIAIVSFAAAAAAQTTVTLSTPGTQINADLTIQGGANSTTDFSGTDSLGSKNSSSSYDRHILLKFDTENFVPKGAVIKSAKLQLVLKASASSETRSLTAYYVTKSFHSGETNWLYYDTGMAWSTAGGDLGASFGTTQVGDAEGWTYTFDVTQLVSKVVSGAYGSRYTRMALIDSGGSSSGSLKEFYSTRATNSAVRPKLVITYTTSTSTTTSSPTVSSSSGTTLRVMQWNIHKTKNSNGVCDPNFTIATIAKMTPDVVSLNELNYFSGVCGWDFDMTERLRSMLQQKTGKTWYAVQDHTSTQPRDAILSRFPLVSSSSTGLSYDRGVAHVGVVVNGRTVNLFSTHIEWDNAWYRPIQIKEALSYVNTFAEPRILMGDFNTWPNTSDYSLFATPLQDAWVAALNSGTASSYNGAGNTHGASRFDYVLYSRSSSVVLNSVNVPNTSVSGVWPSDHDPVVAVFSVK
jgi:endonuclease/exonuclease/phosphatase family metal-dependent hydrolase